MCGFLAVFVEGTHTETRLRFRLLRVGGFVQVTPLQWFQDVLQEDTEVSRLNTIEQYSQASTQEPSL